MDPDQRAAASRLNLNDPSMQKDLAAFYGVEPVGNHNHGYDPKEKSFVKDTNAFYGVDNTGHTKHNMVGDYPINHPKNPNYHNYMNNQKDILDDPQINFKNAHNRLNPVYTGGNNNVGHQNPHSGGDRRLRGDGDLQIQSKKRVFNPNEMNNYSKNARANNGATILTTNKLYGTGIPIMY